jgi:hypothetical protein
VYASMARSCNVHVPGTGQRLYVISHRHDGDVWFATVGKTLTGRRPVWKGRKRTAFYELATSAMMSQWHSDGAQ